MPRIRTVKPEYFTHPEVTELSIPARLLFISLWTQADDEGRLYDQPKKIEGNSFGENDSVSVDELLSELAAKGRIARYEARNRRCIQVRNFTKHQPVPPSKSRPSVVPKLPRGSSPADTEQTDGSNEADTGQDDGSEIAARNREQGTGNGTGNGRQSRAHQLPSDWKPDDELIEWASENHSTVDPLRETEKFKNHAAAKGRVQKNWNAAWRNWIIQAEEFASLNGHEPNPSSRYEIVE